MTYFNAKHVFLTAYLISIVSLTAEDNLVQEFYPTARMNHFGSVEFPRKWFRNYTSIELPPNTPVKAIRSGKVTKVGWVEGFQVISIVVQISENEQIVYSCLSKPIIKPAMRIEKGQIIGFSGTDSHRCGYNPGIAIWYLRNSKKIDPRTIPR